MKDYKKEKKKFKMKSFSPKQKTVGYRKKCIQNYFLRKMPKFVSDFENNAFLCEVRNLSLYYVQLNSSPQFGSSQISIIIQFSV